MTVNNLLFILTMGQIANLLTILVLSRGTLVKSFTCDRCKAPTTYDHHYVILRREMDLCERCLGDFKYALKVFMDNQTFMCWSSDDPMRIEKAPRNEPERL